MVINDNNVHILQLLQYQITPCSLVELKKRVSTSSNVEEPPKTSSPSHLMLRLSRPLSSPCRSAWCSRLATFKTSSPVRPGRPVSGGEASLFLSSSSSDGYKSCKCAIKYFRSLYSTSYLILPKIRGIPFSNAIQQKKNYTNVILNKCSD